MEKGIITKFECPSCGNILKFAQVLQTTKTRSTYKFEAPTKCSCGRLGGMTLISFEPATVTIEPDNDRAVTINEAREDINQTSLDQFNEDEDGNNTN